jgi:dihydroorotate dehydrogenase (fumarate)
MVVADLHTSYLGLDLRTPLVASASPLTGTTDGLRRLEDAGAAAVVLPSLFEEEVGEQGHELEQRPVAYLKLVEQAKAALSVPVIASLNGVSLGGWTRYAALLEQAGADALELNVYYVSSSPGLSGAEVELGYLDLVRSVRRTLRIPLAVKVSPYFSSIINLAARLAEVGAGGLVLFNRFYQPDLDVEALEVVPRLELSTSAELRLPLRWIAILHGRVSASLAASTGVHTPEDAVKALLAGADVVMMTSALLRHGPGHVRTVEAGLRAWLERHGHQNVGEVRGRLSQRAVRDPAAYERANYLRMLASHPAPADG